MAYKNIEKSVSRENPPYLTSTFRKLVLVVLNIYNTVHKYKIKKSGTITGKAAILEPQIQTNIWVASVDATQKSLLNQTRNQLKTCRNLFQRFFYQIPAMVPEKLYILE